MTRHQHRSGWYSGIIGNPSQPSKLHWFDNDEHVSVCGMMPYRKPMVYRLSFEEKDAQCKLCTRMVAAERRER